MSEAKESLRQLWLLEHGKDESDVVKHPDGTEYILVERKEDDWHTERIDLPDDLQDSYVAF